MVGPGELKVLVDIIKLEALTTTPFTTSPVVLKRTRPQTLQQVADELRRQAFVPARSLLYMLTDFGWVDMAGQPLEEVDAEELRVRVVLQEGGKVQGEDALDALVHVCVSMMRHVRVLLPADMLAPVRAVWGRVSGASPAAAPPPVAEHTLLIGDTGGKPVSFGLSNVVKRPH